jgi:ATP-dependent DNA ligase
MTQPLSPKLKPMEAAAVAELPQGGEWQYEPKRDGFRCLAFRDGDQVLLQSKSGQPLARYFPDLVTALRAVKCRRFVLDGEIVVPVAGRLSFDELLMRVHPAASRVRILVPCCAIESLRAKGRRRWKSLLELIARLTMQST